MNLITNNRLFGILYLDDKRTDIDKKGNHLKKFKSFYEPQKELIIKTKKTNMHRTYAIINYLDNSINEYLEQQYFNDILFGKILTCNWSLKLNNLKDDKMLTSYLIDMTPERIIYNDIEIISIDPPNCIDIDDAISYRINNNNIEIFIHIADPSSYIDLKSEIGKELINRCESIYLDKIYHMIPEILNINHISLLENKLSRAFSLIIKFNTINITEISECIKKDKYTYNFVKTHIKVTKNLSYDIFEKNRYDNKYYSDLYNIGKEILYGIYNNDINDYDSHKMVEAYMLFCNHLAANHTHIKRVNTVKKINNDMNNKLYNNKLYKNCLQNAAEYTYENKIHEGLGILYTHFTSPMRRYIDFINHIIIFNNIYNKNKIDDINLEHVNKIHKYYKKIYNIRNIHKLLDGRTEITRNAQIIFIEGNNLRILIDELLINVNIFDNKLINNNIIEIKEQDEYKIIFKYKEKDIKFELFQHVLIHIYLNKMEINPYKIIINDIYDIFE